MLSAHVAACDTCDARLESIEETSDDLVRALSSLPVVDEDESTFRQLHARLLAEPEIFQGSWTEPHLAADDDLPVALALPYRLGNYELREQIGAGAHGAVFRAQHLRLEREVAIKLLIRAAGPFVEEFLHEMRVVGQLDHPNIIRATDAGEYEGTYFLAMELVPGLDVSSLLRRSGPLSVADSCEIARQTALGLAFAHDHQLVHRDVKTSNLLFSASGTIKLLDLGLATISSRAESAETPARSGPRGTADYMAPEQWIEANTVSHKADLYSLGCTLFKLMTGEPPYRQLPDGIVSKEEAHKHGKIPSLLTFRDDVPTAVDQLVTRLMSKVPADRPESANDVAEALATYCADADLAGLIERFCPELKPFARPTRVRKAIARPSMSRRTWITSAVLAAGAAMTLMIYRGRGQQPVSIETGSWRNLVPVDPALITFREDNDARVREVQGQFELESSSLALLHLGTPLAMPYRWKSSLARASWEHPAGVFFRFRKTAPATFSFQTIEIQANSPGQTTLLWCDYQDSHLREPVILAETNLALDIKQDCELEILVGRSGFPDISLDGQRIPKSHWILSKEARDFVVTNTEQLSEVYAGRIGILHHRGLTEVQSAQLMYLGD